MVDYSLVWSDYPSISFFFAQLCGLLGTVGRECPRVGLFVEKNYPYRFVFLLLFPLVHRSLGIALSLIMLREGSWSCKASLSSSKDRGHLEVTSPSTPHKAWGICCSLKEKDEKRIRDRFKFPSSVKITIPDGDDKACHSYADEVCFYEANFINGLTKCAFLLLQLA